MINGYTGTVRLCMFLFPEADETNFIALNRKNMKISCLFWLTKEKDDFY